jgi:hypothetical protein
VDIESIECASVKRGGIADAEDAACEVRTGAYFFSEPPELPDPPLPPEGVVLGAAGVAAAGAALGAVDVVEALEDEPSFEEDDPPSFLVEP